LKVKAVGFSETSAFSYHTAGLHIREKIHFRYFSLRLNASRALRVELVVGIPALVARLPL
jgi:hypothetical protein